MTRYPFFKLLACGAVILFFLSCNKQSERGNALRNVILTTVTGVSGDSSTDYPGIVEEGASVSAAFMADGKIAKITVKEGDRIKKGQLIASLDDSDYRIGVSQLETQFSQMTKEKERMDAMYEKHNIAPNDYEKFEAGYKQLKLQLEMAKRKLDYTRLHSPSDGYVSTKYLNEGELAGAGTPIVNIVDDSRLIASVDMPLSVYLEKEKITGAGGSVPGIAGTIPLNILSFTPDADNNMLYHLKLAIPAAYSKDLTPGMNISISLDMSGNSTAGSMIPSRALFSENGKSYVWIFNQNDSTIHKQEVIIEGAPTGNMSKVKGLSNGEKIVETGVKQLYEGEKVRVVNRKDLDI